MFRIEIINLKGLLDSLGAASRQVDDEFLNLESAKQLLRELKVTVEEREKFFLPKPESLEVETKRANELGAKRKQLETALRKSEMFYGYGSDSQELKRELDLISTELIRQTSLVRGLMGLPKLDGRSFATDAYLRGHFFGQTYPRQLLEISRQKAKVQKLRMKSPGIPEA